MLLIEKRLTGEVFKDIIKNATILKIIMNIRKNLYLSNLEFDLEYKISNIFSYTIANFSQPMRLTAKCGQYYLRNGSIFFSD